MERRLYRSRDKKVVAGIAGGLGEYLDIDPVIIRILIVLITIFHGIGIIIYIVMWIIIPEVPYNKVNQEKSTEFSDDNENTILQNPGKDEVRDKALKSSSNSRKVFGVILIFIGVFLLFEKFIPFFDFAFIISISLILLGLAMVFNFFNKSEKAS